MGMQSSGRDEKEQDESHSEPDISAPPNSGVTPKADSSSSVPPSLFQESGAYNGQIPLDHGEVVRKAFSGALSAPPPPGFDIPLPLERTYKLNQLLWNDQADAEDAGDYNVPYSKRTTSFTNLAAVLGTGLVESMDDSTRDQQNNNRKSSPEQQRVVGQSFDPTQDLSYTRQSRHAASRMIGTSSRSSIGAIGSGYGEGARSSAPLSPHKEEAASSAKQAVDHRQTTPLGIFGRPSERALPPVDLGLTVMEPDSRRSTAMQTGSGTPLSQRSDYELEHGMHHLSMSEEVQQRRSPFEGSTGEGSRPLDVSQLRIESELLPFMWDVSGTEPSRALVILRASSLYISDIRSTCEAFGVLENFRSDFADYGIIFVCYFDIRSAQYAALELQSCLKRLATPDRPANDIRVHYCVPLNASSANDESFLLLSEVPPGVSEEVLSSVLSSYGAVRSLRRRSPPYGGASSYAVEFHNIQDARQALLELESTQPWGSDMIVEVGARSPTVRKRGRELLALIGRWRQAVASGRHPSDRPHDDVPVSGVHVGSVRPSPSSSSSPLVASPEPQATYGHYALPSQGQGQGSLDDTSSSTRSQPHQTTQLVLGPDGRYSYMVVNHSGYHPSSPTMDQNGQVMPQQHGVHGHSSPYMTHGQPAPGPGQPHTMHYWQHAPQQHPFHVPGTVIQHQPHYSAGANPSSAPYYAHGHPNPTEHSSISSGSAGNPALGVSPRRVVSSLEDKDNRHLMLDIEAVESGRDTRTSLMIRNIPNKYTQHMLLSELTENGHGPGIIDFFYLPIDFKNRCNRGYAFVNFVDYRDIVPFHRQYYGQHWSVFNSDKICDVTYARIQGKSGMLKRFENSALMEKDDEYKPLVFVSHGVDKGKRIPFP